MFILIGIVLSPLLAAMFLPWMMLLVSIGLGGAGIAFLVSSPVRMAVQERFPFLVTHPKSRIITGGVVGYCVLLFGFSVSTLRMNWQLQAHEQQVAVLVKEAESSLGLGELDRAIEITQRLETDRATRSSSKLTGLRKQVDDAIRVRDVKRANERVMQLVNTANQDFSFKRHREVETALNEVFRTPGATEFQKARQLANKLLDAKVASAKSLINADDLNGATTLALEAEKLPGVTETRGLTELLAQIANLNVAAKVALANDHFQAKRLDDAERELNAAMSTKNATELAEARSLLDKVASERSRIANIIVGKLVAQASGLPPEEAIKKLNEAISTLHATDLSYAKQKLDEVVGQMREQEKQLARVAAAREAEANQKLKAAAEAEASRKAEEEFDANGLVLLRKTLAAKRGNFGGEITGEVVNRRSRKLRYAQITFTLYDESGAQVGSALANINDLEPGGKWKFKASSIGTDFASYKFSELSGF